MSSAAIRAAIAAAEAEKAKAEKEKVDCEKELEKCYELYNIQREIHSENHPETIATLNEMAICLNNLGR